MIFCKNPLTYTATPSSENVNRPAGNVKDIKAQFDLWETLTTSGENIVLDLASSTAVQAICIINANYNQVQVQGNDTDSWGTPSFDITRNIYQDKFTERWRIMLTPTDLSGFNYRYIRVLPSGSVQDGSSVFRTGGIGVFTDAEIVLQNPSWGFTVNTEKPTRTTIMESGRREKISIGRRHITVTFSNEVDRVNANFEQFSKFLVQIDETEELVFWFGDEFVEDTNNPQYVYVFTREGGVGYTIPNSVLANSDTITLREEV